MNSYPLYCADPILVKQSPAPVPYLEAQDYMQARAGEIAAETAGEQIWFLEHPPLYTAGTSAKARDLIAPSRFDVFKSGRGGQYTYHGPGQRVVYVMFDLKKRGRDVRCFVSQLESVIIDSLTEIGVEAGRREGRIGVWITHRDQSEAKIAALGVRVRKWVTFHGISINLSPDLSHFDGIVPCGISDHSVTSLKALGYDMPYEALDTILLEQFSRRFGPISAA